MPSLQRARTCGRARLGLRYARTGGILTISYGTGRPAPCSETRACRIWVVLSLTAGMCAALPTPGLAQPGSKPAAIWKAWGDQGDGTYVNPIIPGDYSDLDAIRVNE